VTPVNDPPVAANSSATTAKDAAVKIVLSGSDPEGSTLTYAVVTSPTHGALSGTAPNLSYQPQTNYFGGDSFTFRVNDGTAGSTLATVSITVVDQVDETPRITSLSLTSSGSSLIWDTVPGKTYRVLYKDSLDAATWRIATQDLVSSGSQLYWVDSSALSVPKRFYLIELVTQ